MTKAKDSPFCIRPFTSIILNANGEVKPCCYIDKKQSDYKGVKDFNIKTSSVDEYWNSDYRQYLQNQFLNDFKPKECQTCWKHEAENTISGRQLANRAHKFLAKTNYEKYLKLLGKLKLDQPQEYEITITNLCNLKCMMCNGAHSSKLLIENHAIGEELNVKQSDYDWSDKTKKNLVESIAPKTVKRMSLLGGESLLVPDIIQILDNFSQTEYAKDLELTVVTNGTVFNERIRNILSKFKKLTVMFSMESTDTQNNYMRFPSNWQTINDNIEGFKSRQNAYLYINCVVQNLNILYIDQLVNFASNNGIHLNLTRLVDPDYLQINNLPISVLELAYQRLNAIPKERLIHTTNVENVTEAVYNMIKNNNEPKKETFEKFKKMIILRDKYRKISIQNYMPELAKEIF